MPRNNLALALPDLYAELDRVVEDVIRAKADRNDREARFPRGVENPANAVWHRVPGLR